MSNKFNITKGLLDAVSGVVKQGQQQQVEQAQQETQAMRQKYGMPRPLTAEQLAAIPPSENKYKGLNSSIRSVYQKSVEESAAEKETALTRINAMYGRAGAARPLSEKKLDPVGKEDADVNNDGKVDKSDSYLKNRRKAIGAAIKNEEVVAEEEQIDELSRGTLTNYVNKVAAKKGQQAGSRTSGLVAAAKKIAMKKKTNEEVEQVAEAERSAGTVFDKNVAKQFTKKKPGEGAGFDSKKTSKGTEYHRRPVENPVKEETEVEEGKVVDALKAVGKKVLTTLGHGSDEDLKKDLQKKMGAKPQQQHGKKSMASYNEELDTPGNSYEHQCAVHVKHAKLGEGKTLYSQHAEPDAQGQIEWYDVMFDEGIVRVETKDLEILESCNHANHTKKKK